MKEREIMEAVCRINAEHFGSDDAYSDLGEVLKLIRFDGGGYFVEKREGQIVAFMIYQITGDHMDCVRRGVTQSAKRQGLGVKLTKKAIRLSNKLNKVYKTYCAVDNLPSLNSNIKCGCRITFIDENWVYLEKKPAAPKQKA